MRTWLRSHAPTLTATSLCVLAAPQNFLGRDSVRAIEIAFVIVFLVLSLALHEAAHAWVAWKCGDPTAKDLGRVTLNPIVSIDPIWSVLVSIVTFMSGMGAFGGAKPVPVDVRRLRHPGRDMMLVAIAGPGTNFVLAIVFYFGWKLAMHYGDYHPADLLPNVLGFSMYSNLLLTVFNLLPIPPLDGSRVLSWLLPPGLREPYVRLESFGIILVFLAVRFVPGVDDLIRTGMLQLEHVVDILTGGTW